MGRIKIDWLQAFQDYLLDEKVSLVQIAAKYCISLSRIKKVSMKQHWKRKKDEMWTKARNIVINESVSSTEEMIRRQCETARYFQRVGFDKLKAYLESKKLSELNINFFLRLMALGLKTERELYPEDSIKRFQTSLKTEEKLTEVSPELVRAAHEALMKNLKRPSLERQQIPALDIKSF